MTTQELLYLLKNPELIQEHQIKSLENLCDTYPFFQSAKAVLLKVLKDKNSYQYNQYLKKTAAHTVDRWVLFDFITSPVFIEKHSFKSEKNIEFEELEVAEAEIIETSRLSKETDNIYDQNNKSIVKPGDISSEHTDKAKLDLLENEITQKPIPFNPNEKHSFSEWLQLTNIQPLSPEPIKQTSPPEKIIAENNPPSHFKSRKSLLIDRFISKNPKIKPTDKRGTTRNLAKDTNVPSEELMTETLARVYTAQHKYKKAIQAYKILILKNPEKSGFFADQIRAIKKLQDTKS